MTKGNALAWLLGAVAVVVIIVVAVPIIMGDRQLNEEEFGIGGGPDVEEQNGTTTGLEISVAEILANPGQYLGRQVVVVSEVEDFYNNNFFSLDGAGIIDDNLLIMSQDGLENVLPEEDPGLFADRIVRVQGIVEEFDVQDVEQNYGIDLDDARFEIFNGGPFINASSVQLIE